MRRKGTNYFSQPQLFGLYSHLLSVKTDAGCEGRIPKRNATFFQNRNADAMKNAAGGATLRAKCGETLPVVQFILLPLHS